MNRDLRLLDEDVQESILILGNAFLSSAASSLLKGIKKDKKRIVLYKNELIRILFRVVFFRIFQVAGPRTDVRVASQ